MLLKNATGPAFPIQGTTFFELSLPKSNTKVQVNALVVKNLNHPLLVSWLTCVELDLVHKSFPFVSISDYMASISNSSISSPRADNSLQIIPSAMAKLTVDPKQLLLNEYPDVIHDHLNPVPMNTPPMHIYVNNCGSRPLLISTARQVPKHYQLAAETSIKDLLEKGVIERVTFPTPWCSPAFFVLKPDGVNVRIVTDFTELNKHVIRPVHPFPSSTDIMQSIPSTAKIFAKLDAVHGYFQLALDKESSLLTTFLLPSGRFKYKRAPMGLSASSDEWCQKSDFVVEGFDFCKKIVDDILIWATSEPELINNCRKVLDKCRQLNVSISAKKLKIAKSLTFAGHLVSDSGIKPDPAQTDAIKKFPRPTNISELRSFMGLVNQLASFLPDLAQITTNLRKLLSPKNAYLWLEIHEQEFLKTKEILTSDLIVKPFDPNLSTFLITDASRLHGLGFALVQKSKNDTLRLIQCGSKSLNDAQRNYAIIELECLGIQYAIQKCKFYLHGKDTFTVITDHKPLLGVFKKHLNDLDNPRLQRIREKIMGYNFSIEWLAGKKNLIADALSRAPVFDATEKEEDIPLPCFTTISCLVTSNPEHQIKLTEMASKADNDYKFLLASIQNTDKEVPNTPQAIRFQKDFHRLSVSEEVPGLILIDSNKIVIPNNYIKKIVTWLHTGHNGFDKTIKLAKDLYYWHGMNNDIKQVINNCNQCKELAPSLQRLTLLEKQTYEETRPMESVGSDLFSYAGKDYIIMVDRFSGFVMCSDPLRSTTSEKIIALLDSWFQILGYPKTIRTDGGPQYRKPFSDYCDLKNIKHEVSSPYNPKSNGLAENAVKSAKHLLIKCNNDKTDFQQALSFWRNVPRQSLPSPAEMLFGRRQKSCLPTLDNHHRPINMEKAVTDKDTLRARMKKTYNKRAKETPRLTTGDHVIIQNADTKRWCHEGIIESVRPDNISFHIKLPSGQVVLRGRRLVKKVSDFQDSPLQLQPTPPPSSDDNSLTSSTIIPSSPSTSASSSPSPPPGRPQRTRKKPLRYRT